MQVRALEAESRCVFTEGLFLCCSRYPKETMERVEELSYGIIHEFREQQKKKLKRTFVSGSDAAVGKVNRGLLTRAKEIASLSLLLVFFSPFLVSNRNQA